MGICESESRNNKRNENFNTLYFVLLMTIDKKVNDSFIIRSDEKFSVIVNKFYEKYPEYRNKNCTFIYNGQIMIHNFTMEQNKCGSLNPRILVAFDYN